MIRKAGTIFAGSLVLLLLCLTGCRQSDSKLDMTLGVVWPFESEQSLFEEGIDMAVEDINNEGGIGGEKLKLFKLDDASEVTTGMADAEKLIKDPSVRAVIGHKTSYVSIPASALYEKAGLVMLSPSSTAPQLTMNGYESVFRVIPSDMVIAKKAAEYIGTYGYKKIVLYYTEDSYGKGLADSFEDQAQDYGITIIDRFSTYSGTEELIRMQEKWEALGYDGFFIAASIEDGIRYVHDILDSGMRKIFVTGDTFNNESVINAAGLGKENIVTSSVFDLEGSTETENFVQEFTKRYGKTPDMYSALGYDAVKILAEALNHTENFRRDEIAAELKSIGTWVGVCGNHEFSDHGDEIGDLVVLKEMINGTFYRISEK